MHQTFYLTIVLSSSAAPQVSASGDLVYAFAPDFRSRLRSRSLLVSTLLPLGRRLGGALSYLARVAFGTALVASVVVVWLAVMALLRGRGDDRDDRGYRGGGFGERARVLACVCVYMSVSK